MTTYWDEWGLILQKAKKGNALAFDALDWLIQELYNYEHEHGGHVLDNYLDSLSWLKLKRALLLCDHQFFREKCVLTTGQTYLCAMCKNIIGTQMLNNWLKKGWITGEVHEAPS